MDKVEAINHLCMLKEKYSDIENPKYRNIDLEAWREKYEHLKSLKPILTGNREYSNLINALSQNIFKREALLSIRESDNSWHNISERGINKALPAIVKKSRNSIDFPYEWSDEKTGHRCCINNGYWGAGNYMLMDALGYFYMLKEGEDRLPEQPSELFSDLESIRKREIELKSDITYRNSNNELLISNDKELEAIVNQKYWFRFDDVLFRKFTKKSMKSTNILKLLTETSNVQFKLVFPVRLKEGSTKARERPYLMNMFSRLFEFGYVDKNVRKSDGAVRGRHYFVTFNTILGELFVHNLKAQNYSWVRNDFYLLPSSAQIFYRKFLIHNDCSPIQIYLENIAGKVHLVDSNVANLMSTVEQNVLEPLKNQGFIKSFHKRTGLNGTKYIIVRGNNAKSQC